MIKKIMLASCLLVASMASQAGIISYNGYERDSAKNFVTGGGLEWLMWDVTNGLSINTALAAHGADGWVLASNDQMVSLFNVFKFGKAAWANNEDPTQTYSTPWSATEDSEHLKFMQLFGYTQMASEPTHLASDPRQSTRAYYGTDANANNLYAAALVIDDHTRSNGTKRSHSASLDNDVNYAWSDTLGGIGVALVRDVRVVPPTQVSLPGSLSLLALGFVTLGFRRRQASRR